MGLLSRGQIDLGEYVRDGETVYCQTETTKGRVEQLTGTLACTDHRVVFVEENRFSDERVVDIDTAAIEEIVYHPANVPWSAIAGLFAAIVGILYISAGGPLVDLIPTDLRAVVPIMLAGFSLVLAGVIWESTGPRLILRTSKNAHWFRDGDLAPIPHVVRGDTTTE